MSFKKKETASDTKQKAKASLAVLSELHISLLEEEQKNSTNDFPFLTGSVARSSSIIFIYSKQATNSMEINQKKET